MEELYSIETEEYLVGSALIDPDNFTEIDIALADFHDEQLADVWRVGRDLKTAAKDVDFGIIQGALERHNIKVPSSRLVHMTNLEGIDCTHAPSYAELVRDLAERRRAMAAVQELGATIHRSNGTWRADVDRLTHDLVARVKEPTPARAAPVTGWEANELLAASFPEPVWAVPGFVPVGLSVLAGRPKIGKSWLALQIAIAKGSGGIAMNQRLEAGKVLYLALEDNGRRLQDRARKQGMPATATIRFETSWPRLTQGGLGLLGQVIDAEGYSFVVLDTIGRALGRVDTNDYRDTTDVVGALQEIAISRDIAVLMLDHTRKPIAGLQGDPVDDIIGSTGKSAVPDAVLSLTKTQGKRGAGLSITGREIPQESYALSWDALTCTWQLDGTAEEAELVGRRGMVLSVLQEAYPEALTAGEIAKSAEMHREKVVPLLNDLVTTGHVTREAKRGKEQPYRAIMQGNEGA